MTIFVATNTLDCGIIELRDPEGLDPCAAFFEQGAECLESGGAEVAELAAVRVLNGSVETGEQGESLQCNAGQDDAAVLILAPAGDEGALFEPVEETGNVGVAGDHSVTDFAAGQAAGLSGLARAAEDSEDVVLVRGEVFCLEDLGERTAKHVGGAKQIEVGGFFRAAAPF